MTLRRAEADPNLAVVEELAPLADDRPAGAGASRSLGGEAWGRIRRSKIAMASLAVLAGYALVALIAFTGVMDSESMPWGDLIEQEVAEPNVPPAFRDAETGGIAPSLWVGTDFLGRSVFWRFLYGSRVALTVGLLASLLSITIGTMLGLLAGYKGGWVDSLVIWLFSTVSSVPGILLILALAFVLRDYTLPFVRNSLGEPVALTGVPVIVLALGLTSWVGICRLIRGEVLKLRDRDFIAATRAVGLGDGRIVFRHILPNVFHLIIIDFSLGLGAFVQAEVVLSFLGLGVTDQPSWGRMIDDAKLELLKGVWWQMAAATLAIFVFSLAVNLFGDALRDAMDPRLRGAE